jgi:hypothetical protein
MSTTTTTTDNEQTKVPASVEYIQQQFALRNTLRKEKENAYTIAKRELLKTYQRYKAGTATKDDVVTANQAVHIAECNLNNITKEPRFVGKYYQVFKGKEINFDTPYDDSGIGDDVVIAEYGTFPYKYFWMDKSQERIPEDEDEQDQQGQQQTQQTQRKQQGGDQQDKARMWAIIRAKRAKAALFK